MRVTEERTTGRIILNQERMIENMKEKKNTQKERIERIIQGKMIGIEKIGSRNMTNMTKLVQIMNLKTRSTQIIEISKGSIHKILRTDTLKNMTITVSLMIEELRNLIMVVVSWVTGKILVHLREVRVITIKRIKTIGLKTITITLMSVSLTIKNNTKSMNTEIDES